MFGLRLLLVLAIVGGVIAYLGDWLGTKIGKKRLSIFGLRPRYTSMLITVVTGIAIAVFSIAMMAVSSNEARIALFGIADLQKQAMKLQTEVEQQNYQLEGSYLEIRNKQSELLNTQGTLKNAEETLVMAQNKLQENLGQLGRLTSEVAQLTLARNLLVKERSSMQEQVEFLSHSAIELEKNINNLREGTVVIQSGQVLRTTVIAGGQSLEGTRTTLNSFIEEANREVYQEYGGTLGGTQGLFMSEEAFEQAVKFLSQNSGIYAVRMEAAGNLYAGEPLLVALDLFPNDQIYEGGDVVYQEVITIGTTDEAKEMQVLRFLNQVNERAVAAGVKPDPIRKTVGSMSMYDIYQIVDTLKKHTGDVRIIAFARQRIYAPGPVRLEIEVESLR